jgi:hypothetical protein
VRRLGVVARRRLAAGGKVERWGRYSRRLDDDGRVEKLPGDVRKLEPGSIWAREGRERELHGEAEAAAAVLHRELGSDRN